MVAYKGPGPLIAVKTRCSSTGRMKRLPWMLSVIWTLSMALASAAPRREPLEEGHESTFLTNETCGPFTSDRDINIKTVTFEANGNSYNMIVNWPLSSDKPQFAPVGILPMASATTLDDYDYRAVQLAQSGFIAFVVDYWAGERKNPEISQTEAEAASELKNLQVASYYLTTLLQQAMAAIQNDPAIPNYPSPFYFTGFGFGANIALDMLDTLLFPDNEGVAAFTPLMEETNIFGQSLPGGLRFPLQVYFPDGLNGTMEWFTSLKFDNINGGEMVKLGLTASMNEAQSVEFGYVTLGFPTYKPCPAELAFQDSVNYFIRMLGPQHEAFQAQDETDPVVERGPQPIDTVPRNALIAIGVVGLLIFAAVFVYSGLPDPKFEHPEGEAGFI
eukprot:g32420.t1